MLQAAFLLRFVCLAGAYTTLYTLETHGGRSFLVTLKMKH